MERVRDKEGEKEREGESPFLGSGILVGRAIKTETYMSN